MTFIYQENQFWVLETDQMAYALGVNQAGYLVNTYWGLKLPTPADYPRPAESEGYASFNGPGQLLPEEYPAYGGAKYIEPCLKATFADGVRDVIWQFQQANTTATELNLTLQDTHYPLQLTLHYRLHPTYHLLERWATVTNLGETPIQLERIWSAQWHLPPAGSYHWRHLTGRWLDEWHVVDEPLTAGVKMVESRRLTTSHHHHPSFMVHRGRATETEGEVWFGSLAWSGNWQMCAEVTQFAQTRLSLGVNDWDFAWQLTPAESFTTPAVLAGYTPAGFGAASRQLHNYIREQLLPHGRQIRPVLYNSWEATLFYFDEQLQKQMANQAAALGIELFVVDDGWFHGRNGDNAGLGDWWADAQKFPNGLTPLVEHVNQLGMAFGLWVEPEMVNPNSELYRTHPDWVIHFPTRPRTELRNQLILNLARPEVQEYLIEKLDALLTNHNITFIKWDMNRNISEPGWPTAGREPRELWVRYVQGLYHVWGTLRRKHPQVLWQTCSGGGGRVDLAMLTLADQAWVSDNSDPLARLGIQEGYAHFFPANTMESWVTKGEWMGDNHAKLSLTFHFHVSMCGSLGVGANLNFLSAGEKEEAKQCIATYKEIRHIVQQGQQYRLHSAQENAFSAVQYMSDDQQEGVLFAFRTHLPEPAPVLTLRLQGLDPVALYQVEGFEQIKSGRAWMNVDHLLNLPNFSSTMRRIRRV